MLPEGPAARLTIHLTGGALWHHRPAYAEIVHRARRAGLPGASALEAIEGFGAHLRVHQEHASRLREHCPVAVVIIDEEHRLRTFLAGLDDILAVTGVAVMDAVHIHAPRSP
ncbi:hypothetical protein SAMN05216223_11833 [Actinacidiphila yanglinensis]|uniref:DUF190 domain-containing protein n=1 Tax=Actinacidiphila yanglinensis TaxID=310779 RepID=A0A1H6DQW1_9ACTN|nr:DUF190 domain-containing protein [Actinacidiphila yanglinensis]SEG87073.1 hypothetical protein SAMN05216223_11833 [Actinacidiphila yanglinensis]